jgi:hypothetical protein
VKAAIKKAAEWLHRLVKRKHAPPPPRTVELAGLTSKVQQARRQEMEQQLLTLKLFTNRRARRAQRSRKGGPDWRVNAMARGEKLAKRFPRRRLLGIVATGDQRTWNRGGQVRPPERSA